MRRRAAARTLLAIALGLGGADRRTDAQALRVERHGYLMGTRVALSVWAADRAEGSLRLERAYRALEGADADLSTWRDESPISTLNRSAVGERWLIPASLCPLFSVLAEWRAATGAAFDPAIGALTQAWDVHGSGRIPTTQQLDAARAASGFDRLNFDSGTCSITRNVDVTIDVGAFGKGEALDRAGSVLDGFPWTIDLGGQISVGGSLVGQSGWRLAIADPHDRTKAVVELSIPSGSLSTSAGSERDLLVDGSRVGHILDPRTGRTATFNGSATVWHERGLVADILSTALFVMGPDAGLRWAGDRRIAACFLEVDTQGRLEMRMTAGFRRLLAEDGSVPGSTQRTVPRGVFPAPGHH
jgi:thiamine biosynthesis lipoprotein